MMFHFGWISKRANILMEMLRHFISGSVYMIFYHPKWKFFFCQNDCNEITPTMSFKRTRALNAISNKPPLVHYVLGNFFNMNIPCGFEILFRPKWPLWSPHRFELISPLMWTSKYILQIIFWHEVLVNPFQTFHQKETSGMKWIWCQHEYKNSWKGNKFV